MNDHIRPLLNPKYPDVDEYETSPAGTKVAGRTEAYDDISRVITSLFSMTPEEREVELDIQISLASRRIEPVYFKKDQMLNRQLMGNESALRQLKKLLYRAGIQGPRGND